MSKNKKNEKKKVAKKRIVETNVRADGTTEYYVSKAPQKTILGRIIIITLCVLLAGTAVLSLIFALAEL